MVCGLRNVAVRAAAGGALGRAVHHTSATPRADALVRVMRALPLVTLCKAPSFPASVRPHIPNPCTAAHKQLCRQSEAHGRSRRLSARRAAQRQPGGGSGGGGPSPRSRASMRSAAAASQGRRSRSSRSSSSSGSREMGEPQSCVAGEAGTGSRAAWAEHVSERRWARGRQRRAGEAVLTRCCPQRSRVQQPAAPAA